MTTDAGERPDEAAAIVAGWPGVAEKLIAAHIAGPDARCVVCWRQRPSCAALACGVALLAIAARRLRNA